MNRSNTSFLELIYSTKHTKATFGSKIMLLGVKFSCWNSIELLSTNVKFS